MVEIEEKVGNPWSILPIKNSKYARDLIEVHLSDRHLTRLEKFEDFPNLEVIWLKNNNVSETSLRSNNYLPVTEPGWHSHKLQGERGLRIEQLTNADQRNRKVQIPLGSACVGQLAQRFGEVHRVLGKLCFFGATRSFRKPIGGRARLPFQTNPCDASNQDFRSTCSHAVRTTESRESCCCVPWQERKEAKSQTRSR